MIRRQQLNSSLFFSNSATSSVLNSVALCAAARGIFADKIRAGNIIKEQGRYYRCISNSRVQKGQGAASYHMKLHEVLTGKQKDMSAPSGKDFPEARTERLKVLFSGFDDDDNACFVYPQHSAQAGQEINIPGSTLPDHLQKWLACAMPVDMLHLMGDDDDTTTAPAPTEGGAGAKANAGAADANKSHYCDIMIPTNYVYTVERLGIKGMYKLAYFEECDGSITVSDNVQIGDKLKVVLRGDGTAGFGGKA